MSPFPGDPPMPAATVRCAALLSASLALAACASSRDAKKDEDMSREEAAAAVKEASGGGSKEEADTPAKGKASFYHNIQSHTDAWMQAYTGSGDGSLKEAQALESAVGGEVWKRFDEVVEDLATSDNPRWRVAAARGLGFVHDLRVLPPLQGALGDHDASVVAAALVSLARAGWVETDDRKVASLLSYPDKVVAGDAALCLARVLQARRAQGLPILDPPARAKEIEADLLVLLFDGSDPIVRGNAAQALGQLGSPTAEDALLNRVRDEHAFVRIKVAHALSQAGSPKAYDVLLDSLGREQVRNVQTVTALAIGAIAERQKLTPPYQDLGYDAAMWRKWLKR
jgi:HEAT repeat protein